MKAINCTIIGDYLPLYLDDLVSNDTRKLVDEHLFHCQHCREKLERMKQNAIPFDLTEQNNPAPYPTKKPWTKKQIIRIILAAVLIAALLVGSFYQFFYRGFKASTDEITVTKAYKEDDNYYLNQAMALTFTIKDDTKALRYFHRTEHVLTEEGDPFFYRHILYLYEVPSDRFFGNKYYTAYLSYPGDNPPPEGTSCILTVVYKDKVVEYDAMKEGLLVPQETSDDILP